jgi:putative IMPACT (imprinted ancient) family translation regulator
MPIYGQIKAYGITNVLVAVVRYFGGTKLGVGGLISAYRITAQNTLEQSRIIEKTLEETFELHFGYEAMNKIMRIIKKESISIVSQTMELECNYVLSVRKKDVEKTKGLFEHIKGVTVISHP